MTDIPKQYDPAAAQQKWFPYWEQHGFFNADPDRRQWAVDAYNRRFNGYVEPRVDGAYLKFLGMSEVWRKKIRQHQRDAVARVLQYGNTLLAHVVGSGKTLTMVASGMELRRMG